MREKLKIYFFSLLSLIFTLFESFKSKKISPAPRFLVPNYDFFVTRFTKEYLTSQRLSWFNHVLYIQFKLKFNYLNANLSK